VTRHETIRGARTRLRPVSARDLDDLAAWRNRHRACFVDSSPVTAEGQAAWHASHRGRDDDLMYVIETLEGRPVGCVALYHLDRAAGTAEFGRLMIGSTEDQHRGYAEDACRALLEHARTRLGSGLVYLQVLAGNRAAAALYEKLGFVRDASRDATRDREGRRIELLGMSLSFTKPIGRGAAPDDHPLPPIAVAVVLPGLTPSTSIRLASPLAWLQERGLVTYALVVEDLLQHPLGNVAGFLTPGRSRRREAGLTAEKSLREADLVILQRSTSPAGERALAIARESGAGVVYECDDNFLAIDRETPEVGAYYDSPQVRQSFVDLLAAADVVTTSCDALSAILREFASDVRTLPNCVDLSLVGAHARPEAAGDALVIGYAGTATHARDFACVAPALRRVLDEGRGSVRLESFGFVPETLLGRPDVRFTPYTDDYPGFLHKLGGVDWSFGLAPLAESVFNSCKTDNKYREYGACLIPGIYSECPAYSRSVSDGVNGLLVPHTEEGWYEGIRRMMADARLRADVARAAREDVAVRYSVEAAAWAWRDVLRHTLSLR